MKFDPKRYTLPALSEDDLRALAQAAIDRWTGMESFIPTLVAEIIRLRGHAPDA